LGDCNSCLSILFGGGYTLQDRTHKLQHSQANMQKQVCGVCMCVHVLCVLRSRAHTHTYTYTHAHAYIHRLTHVPRHTHTNFIPHLCLLRSHAHTCTHTIQYIHTQVRNGSKSHICISFFVCGSLYFMCVLVFIMCVHIQRECRRHESHVRIR